MMSSFVVRLCVGVGCSSDIFGGMTWTTELRAVLPLIPILEYTHLIFQGRYWPLMIHNCAIDSTSQCPEEPNSHIPTILFAKRSLRDAQPQSSIVSLARSSMPKFPKISLSSFVKAGAP